MADVERKGQWFLIKLGLIGLVLWWIFLEVEGCWRDVNRKMARSERWLEENGTTIAIAGFALIVFLGFVAWLTSKGDKPATDGEEKRR